MADLPKHQTPGVPFTERRTHPRRRVETLIYVGLGEDNGGIVLNLSEGGMSFHAAVPMQQFHFPKVRFQLPVSGNWTEVAGDIAWMNEGRTSAGLKFLDLAEEARAEIRSWAGGQTLPAIAVPAGKGDEIGQAPRTPRIAVPRPDAAPAGKFEADAPSLIEAPERREETSPLPAVASEAEMPTAVARHEEMEAEPAQSEAETVESSVDESSEPREVPVSAARNEESREAEGGHVVDVLSRDEQLAEVAVARGPVESPAAAESQEAAAAEEDEIVAAALAHAPAPAAEEKRVHAVAPAQFGESLHPAGGAVWPGKTVGSFDWEKPRGQKPERTFSGGAIAAAFLGTAAIFFGAGWLVGHGSLSSWIHTSADTSAAKAAIVAPAGPAATTAAPAATTAAPGSVPSGAHPGVQTAAPTGAANGPAGGTAGTSTTGGAASAAAPTSPPVATNTAPPMVVAMPAGGETSSTVDLPVEPVSASSTIAVSATRSVEIPAAGAGGHAGSAHIQPGDLISHAQPDYPAETMQEQVEGTVKLRVTVGKDGGVKQIEPMGGPPALVSSSVAAVQQWRYRPTYVNGRPVEVQEIVSVVFRLPTASGANP